MYSPINEDFLLQVMHDRVAQISAARGKGNGTLPNRRWWRKATHVAE